MRLYHPRVLILLLLLAFVAGCAAPPISQAALIAINLNTGDHEQSLQVPAGSTVDQALRTAGVSLGALDRTEPPLYAVLNPGAQVRVIRVTEKFDIQQVVIPYGRQVLRNESLPLDKEVLLQRGKNGLEEVTYRRVFEDGVEVSGQAAPIKSTLVEEALPEIVMVGIQAPLYPIAIPGRLIYLRDGNVWVIESATGNRRAVLTTGDLDGRIFSLSDDGAWLLFTRRADTPGQINTLWAADIRSENGKLVDLKIQNVIHFAGWVPGSNTKVVFSTVEPRAAAPGWQANNDLNIIGFSTSGWTTKRTVILEPNTGGIYGWWGMSFRWSPDGKQLAFARPDGLGLLTFSDGSQTALMDLIPFQARGDWAWVPGLSWGPDGKILYTVDHVPPQGSSTSEESPYFDLTAFSLEAGRPLHLISQAGMFAYPQASPLQPSSSGETAYQIAYLQAVFPSQSDTSRYRVAVMDRDGSDRRSLFPAEGQPGLDPQQEWGAWSPEGLPESGDFALAVLYQGNLWLVDTVTGQAQQVTSDGLTTRVIWK